MNAVVGAGAAPTADWLLICMAHEGTTIAILRGGQLMFYRHRASDRRRAAERARPSDGDVSRRPAGGFDVRTCLLCGAALADVAADRVRWEISESVGRRSRDGRRAASGEPAGSGGRGP